MKLTIGHLYPDLLNLYGDRGNIQCMKKRCEWRGIEAEVREFQITDAVDFTKLDLVLLGGGSDREQMLVCEKLKAIRENFRAYVEDGGSVIAVCGGYQLLGHYYDTDDGILSFKMTGWSFRSSALRTTVAGRTLMTTSRLERCCSAVEIMGMTAWRACGIKM